MDRFQCLEISRVRVLGHGHGRERTDRDLDPDRHQEERTTEGGRRAERERDGRQSSRGHVNTGAFETGTLVGGVFAAQNLDQVVAGNFTSLKIALGHRSKMGTVISHRRDR